MCVVLPASLPFPPSCPGTSISLSLTLESTPDPVATPKTVRPAHSATILVETLEQSLCASAPSRQVQGAAVGLQPHFYPPTASLSHPLSSK